MTTKRVWHIGGYDDVEVSEDVPSGSSATVEVIPAYLGWGNPERDTVGMRLYATDKDDSPRWANEQGGRVAEYALAEQGFGEGDRFLVVRLGDRFTSQEAIQRAANLVTEVVNAVIHDGV